MKLFKKNPNETHRTTSTIKIVPLVLLTAAELQADDFTVTDTGLQFTAITRAFFEGVKCISASLKRICC